MITGFKNFLLRGNLIELAVAFIMALAFTAVVTATVDLITQIIGKIGGDASGLAGWQPGGISFGFWLLAILNFVVMAAVVYFLIVVPYTKAKETFFPADEPGTPDDIQLLEEIRDLLAQRSPGA